MAVYVDIHGVVCDFVGAVAEVFGHDGDSFKRRWPKGEASLSRVLGVTNSRMWAEIDREGPDLWANALPLLDGSILVEQLKASGEEWYFCTSPGLSSDAVKGVVQWMQHNYGPLIRNYIITEHKHLLARPGDTLIDDRPHNCSQWRENGGSAVLVPRPWNSGIDSRSAFELSSGEVLVAHWRNPGVER